MKINKFIYELLERLNKNLFYNVKIYKEYNKHDETYLIRIIAKNNYDEYDCEFTIDKDYLDNTTIQEILNCLLEER